MAMLQSATAGTFEWHNGETFPSTESAKGMLLRCPNGPYTTMRTWQSNSILKLDHHLERLASSTRHILKERNIAPPDAETFCNSESLRPILLKPLHQALSFAELDISQAFRIVILLSITATNPVDIFLHLEPLPPRPDSPIKVVASRRLSRRSMAGCKNSLWVAERAEVERQKPADVNEVLMIGDDDAISEGISSNFFVLRDDVIQTASLSDGIIGGSIRELVLTACARIGITVKQTAPKFSERSSWSACFISSSSRLLLPICEIRDLESGEVLRTFEPNDIGQRLESEVTAQLETESTKIL